MTLNQIGVIGLAVMGKNLAFNFADKGFKTAIYNRTTKVTDDVMQEIATNNEPFATNLTPYADLESFVASLERPRKVVLMIKAGAPIDAAIDTLIELLDPDDIIVDGGNSYFKDTNRREQIVENAGLQYVGLGVSGGEQGARFGPAMMPGGSKDAYKKLEPILTTAAASYNGEPCCKFTAKGGAGHFVKMVHNGIEYADMELIAETYFILKRHASLDNKSLASLFDTWNNGVLESYLMEITGAILKEPDYLTDGDLIDAIEDVSHQKGTGKWTTQEAAELSVDVSMITAGLNARYMSMLKDERIRAATVLPRGIINDGQGDVDWVELSENALYAAKIIDYAQGFKLLAAAGATYGWDYNFKDIVAIFRSGCIIRAALLEDIRTAYTETPDLEHLLLSPHIISQLEDRIGSLREFVVRATASGIPVPAYMAALSYYDAYRTNPSSANMIQAQRDFFGAHTFERTDQPGFVHHEWG